MDRRSLALIGAGRWGKNLARNFDALGALHTICDAHESTLNALSEQYPHIQCTTNYSAILNDPAIKQVVIASQACHHYFLAKQALIAGKDLYVEKPLSLTLAEGEELAELAHEKRAILMVGHLLHYHPCVQHLKVMVDSGELGTLSYIASNRIYLGNIRAGENVLWDLAPHDISVILSLFGDQLPEEVLCRGNAAMVEGVVDTAMTTLRFENGAHAHIYTSWFNPFKEQRLVVVGSKAMAVFDDTKSWEEKLLLYRNPVNWESGEVPLVNQVEAERVDIAPGEPLKEECLHFLECCEKRTQPLTDGQEGVRVLRVLEEAQASLEASVSAFASLLFPLR